MPYGLDVKKNGIKQNSHHGHEAKLRGRERRPGGRLGIVGQNHRQHGKRCQNGEIGACALTSKSCWRYWKPPARMQRPTSPLQTIMTTEKTVSLGESRVAMIAERERHDERHFDDRHGDGQHQRSEWLTEGVSDLFRMKHRHNYGREQYGQYGNGDGRAGAAPGALDPSAWIRP